MPSASSGGRVGGLHNFNGNLQHLLEMNFQATSDGDEETPRSHAQFKRKNRIAPANYRWKSSQRLNTPGFQRAIESPHTAKTHLLR